MSEHSDLAPSSASVWGAPLGCRGSVKVLRGRADPDTAAAEEGTAAHELAVHLHAGTSPPKSFLGAESSEGYVYDADMVRYVPEFTDTVRRRRIAFGGEHEFFVEKRVAAPTLIHPQLFGTLDASAYHPGSHTLYLCDLKYGRIAVSAYANWQLVCYAAGAIETFGINPENLRIEMEIVQPRDFSSRHKGHNIWSVTWAELQPYIASLRLAAFEVYADSPPLRSGPQCKYCRVRHECPSAIEAGLTMYDAVNEGPLETWGALEKGQFLSLLNKASTHIESLKTALSAELESLLRSGKPVPGWAMQPKQGREKWNSDYEATLAAGLLNGTDLRQKKLLTPAQAREAGVSEEVVAALSGRPIGSLALKEQTSDEVERIFST